MTDVELAERILRQHATDGGFDPEALAGSPMYEILVSGAAWQFVEGEAFVTRSWSEVDGLRRRRREGATADVVDA